MSRPVERVVIGVSAVCVIGSGIVLARDRLGSSDPRSDNEAQIVPDSLKYSNAGHLTGPADAVHTLVVFGDFQCPYCRTFAHTIDSLIQRNPHVRVLERHFPLVSLHPFAMKAALASECGAEVGRFHETSRALYLRPAILEAEEWGTLGRIAGVPDTSSFSLCVTTSRYKTKVELDVQVARRLGLRGTASVLLDNRLYSQPPTLDELEADIGPPPKRR
jgi:protein-disulfide isomerase